MKKIELVVKSENDIWKAIYHLNRTTKETFEIKDDDSDSDDDNDIP